MSPREPPREEDPDDLAGPGEVEQPEPATSERPSAAAAEEEPEPERAPKPVRTGSIPPPRAPEPAQTNVPAPAEPSGGLLGRIRRKLGR